MIDSTNPDLWSAVAALQEPSDLGRRLEVGGFVLYDPFDTFLTHISEAYLQAAWERLHAVLTRFQLTPPDLSWGAPHPGETHVPNRRPPTPSDFLGWTSRMLAHVDADPQFARIDHELRNGAPVMRCVTTWRSHKWRIAPAAYPLALQLIEAYCSDEGSAWSPTVILGDYPGVTEPWLVVAQAIAAHDQALLDHAMAMAHARYTPIGYRIVWQAYRRLLIGVGQSATLQLPPQP